MYVFVYGTLKRGGPNHYVMETKENGEAKFICEGKTCQLFPLIKATSYQVPFLLDKAGIGKNVKGEIYDADEKMLQFLDKFERVPEVYNRRMETIKIISEDGQEKLVSAWIYVFHSFISDLLNEEFLDNYICNNYDLLRSLSGKFDPEERAKLLSTLRGY